MDSNKDITLTLPEETIKTLEPIREKHKLKDMAEVVSLALKVLNYLESVEGEYFFVSKESHQALKDIASFVNQYNSCQCIYFGDVCLHSKICPEKLDRYYKLIGYEKNDWGVYEPKNV